MEFVGVNVMVSSIYQRINLGIEFEVEQK